MEEPAVYLNGNVIPASQASIAIYDKGIVMGATVTEMLRTYNHHLFRLNDHLDRLFYSLRVTHIDPGMTKEDFADISVQLVEQNVKHLEPSKEIGLVQFITAGKVEMYAGKPLSEDENRPTVCLHTFPISFESYAPFVRQGYHLITPAIQHIPSQCIDSRMKHRSRMHLYLAEQESQKIDPSATSLLLDHAGNITECTNANILVVKDGSIYSPPLENILEGVSRKVAIELASNLKIPFLEQSLKVTDVLNAEEVILASTPYGLCSATRLNEKPIGDGNPGPVWRGLMDAWSDLVGLDAVRQFTH